MQTPVLRDIEVPKHTLESYHRLIARVVILWAEDSEDIYDIGPTGDYIQFKGFDDR
jgi:hypothetical protein